MPEPEVMSGVGVGGTTLVLMAALTLGLRHATDPDHLTAVAALVLGDGGKESAPSSPSRPWMSFGAGRAGLLGLSWGLGHAVTFLMLGLPVVLLRVEIPESVQASAEISVGLLIVFLAVRLVYRWRETDFHAHGHVHRGAAGEEGTWHVHPHVHGGAALERHPPRHEHRHAEALGRSPWAAFGIGLVHGVGGSAAAGILLVAAAPAQEAVLALALFAGGTAASMALVSGVVGHVLVLRSARSRMRRMVPMFGAASFVFGIWYAVTGAMALL